MHSHAPPWSGLRKDARPRAREGARARSGERGNARPAPCPAVLTRRGAGSGLEGGRRLPAPASGAPRALEAASGPRGRGTSSPGPLPPAAACPRPRWGFGRPAPCSGSSWGWAPPWAGSDPPGGSPPPPCRWRSRPGRRRGARAVPRSGFSAATSSSISSSRGRTVSVGSGDPVLGGPPGGPPAPLRLLRPWGSPPAPGPVPPSGSGEGTAVTHAMRLHHRGLSKRRSWGASRRAPPEILGSPQGWHARSNLSSPLRPVVWRG